MDNQHPEICAVITADVVDSSSLAPEEMGRLIDHVNDEFKARAGKEFWVTRGDSFQWLIKDPRESMKRAFFLKSVVALWDKDSSTIVSSPRSDVRLSIGIGRVSLLREDLSESVGPAFVRSGRGLDMLKEDRNGRLAVITGNSGTDRELALTTFMMSAIVSRWSYASMEVLYWYLKGIVKQKEIALKIGIGQSSVQRRMEAMDMDVVNRFFARFSVLISDL